MKLLFDENLSPRLALLLADVFPQCQHVDLIGLHGRADWAIWESARELGLTIVSKDNDFRQMSFLHGPPPKVVWLAVGNAGTDQIAHLLRRNHAGLLRFDRNNDDGLLILDLEETVRK